MQRAMKLIAKIAIGILLAVLIAWAISDPTDFRHKLFGYSKEEQDQAWENVKQAQWRVDQSLRAQTIEARKKYVRLKFGEAAALQYELCETSAPTEKANQKKCERLLALIKHAEANEPKW